MTLCTYDRQAGINRVLFYAGATAFLGLFGAVYEVFSHGVYSNFMVYAFTIPLMAGLLPTLVCIKLGWAPPSCSATQLYAGAVMMLAAGSVMRGVVDIYGTTNGKLVMFPILATVMLAVALFVGYSDRRRKPNELA
ncbi:MAG: hypothetical protein Q4B54_06620 [Coriobacteriales bacterium]|nr:hypothetical protein [Coriobacteriales bacterium]